MDGQPGHLLSGPGVEEEVAYQPVDQEEAETSRLGNTAQDADQAEDYSYLLIERNDHQVVIPGLVATRHLLLLYPVIDTLPDTITDATGRVGKEYGEQHQENGPATQQRKEPVRPGHGDNGVQQRLFLWIDELRQSTSFLGGQFARHLTEEQDQHKNAQCNTKPGDGRHRVLLQIIDKLIGLCCGSSSRSHDDFGEGVDPVEQQPSRDTGNGEVDHHKQRSECLRQQRSR